MSNVELNSMSGGSLIATTLDGSGDHVQVVSESPAGVQQKLLSRYLDLNGDGTGSKNHTADNSGAADIAYIQPGAGAIYRISRVIVCVEDTSGFSAAEYGNLGSALANGIQVRHENGSGTVVDFTDGDTIKTNSGWAGLCYDVDLKTWGTGNELLVVRWTFSKTGQYLRLVGSSSDRLEVVLNDNFTGLVTHKFLVQGYEE